MIVDATFKNRQHRQQFLELSSRHRLPVLFVECRASEEKTLERLKNRQLRRGEVSDATVAVYLRQRNEFGPLSEIPDSMRMIVSTENNPEEGAQQVLDSLGRIFAARKPSPGLRQL